MRNGQNALELARNGLDVVAVDSSPVAIEAAQGKAVERGLDVEFVVADAHDLVSLSRRFTTILDSALLHVIDGRDRYSAQIASVIEPNDRLVLLEISDDAPIPYPKISEPTIWDALRILPGRSTAFRGTDDRGPPHCAVGPSMFD